MSTLKQTVITFCKARDKDNETRLTQAANIYAALSRAERAERATRSAAIRPWVEAHYGEGSFSKAAGSTARTRLSRILDSIEENLGEVKVSQADKAKVRVPVDCVNAVEKLLGKWTKAQITAALKKFE